jgi:tRNA A-37 threonylcarbamoyl transferase component Bud32/membrane-associated phospholipid phosphatase
MTSAPGQTTAAPSPTAGIARSRRRRRPSGEPPPLPRQLTSTSRYWLILAAAVLAFCLVAGTTSRTLLGVGLVDHDIQTWLARLRSAALTHLMRGVGWPATPLAIQIVWLANLLVLLLTRRWRQLFVWMGSLFLTLNVVGITSALIQRPRPLGVVILGPWVDFAMPSLPMAVLATVSVNTLYALVPHGRLRETGKWIVGIVLAVVALSRLYLAQDNPSDALVGIVLGITIPLVAFRLLAPNEIFPVSYRRRRAAHLEITDRRRTAILDAVQDQLGIIPLEIQPFGLEGSGGSTPLRIKIKGDPDRYAFGKLYAATHLRSDRWYKLGRTLLYGGLEDEKAFNSVRRLVQYEDYLLRLLYSAGLPVPRPGGIVEITPEREYLLVMEFFDGAREIGDVDVDQSIIDQGLHVIRQLWEAGLAHRDIKPANVLVRDGELLLIDSAFAEVRPSPWRQAVDLANMMLVLALRSDARTVYERALEFFTVDEIAEAFAATRGLTMPSQLRRMIRAQGRDLHAEFKRLLPYEVRPIAIQRWSARRLLLTLAVLIAAILFALTAAQLLVNSPLS